MDKFTKCKWSHELNNFLCRTFRKLSYEGFINNIYVQMIFIKISILLLQVYFYVIRENKYNKVLITSKPLVESCNRKLYY